MTKQEKIQEAYGEYWEIIKDYVDENGWLNLSIAVRKNIGEIGSKTYQFRGIEKGNPRYCRILSLSELENNNGWIKIESEDDLPKEINIHYHGIKDGEFIAFILKRPINTKALFRDFTNDKITHYQQITRPQPPIY